MRLSVGITGHRHNNAAFDRNRVEIQAAFIRLLDIIDAVIARQADTMAATRLHSLMASGTDVLAVENARARNWEIVALLPFGQSLNMAINGHPLSIEDALALIEDRAEAVSPAAAYVDQVRQLAAHAKRFELAEQDELIKAMFVRTLQAPEDGETARAFATVTSERAAAAGRVMIEQSDVIIAVWDGIAPGAVGGTRHTMAAALEEGVPVIWINASDPEQVRLLRAPESLLVADRTDADVASLIENIVNPPGANRHESAIRFHTEQWHPHSHRRFHAYRRIETLFGGGGSPFAGLKRTYERPDTIGTHSGAPLLADADVLPGRDADLVAAIRTQILPRFAWADGLSTYLSDAYRGGMVTNFLLSALAIMGGAAYLPFVGPEEKWPFALLEFALLVSIVAITTIGRKRRWHSRWFETRRVAEYLRHAPMMLLLGVVRSAGRWPRGAHSQWPEHYCRLVLRDIGLPQARVTQAYLQQVLKTLLAPHVREQRDYHRDKAKRLAKVHHNLDRLSELLFALAIATVALYLLLVLAASLAIIPVETVTHSSKAFTFLGVAFPALGGAFAGIRYFGDFERFSAISEVTAEKLDGVSERIDMVLAAPENALSYSHVAGMTREIDEIVVDEIENWQAVFAGKQISVPV